MNCVLSSHDLHLTLWEELSGEMSVCSSADRHLVLITAPNTKPFVDPPPSPLTIRALCLSKLGGTLDWIILSFVNFIYPPAQSQSPPNRVLARSFMLFASVRGDVRAPANVNFYCSAPRRK